MDAIDALITLRVNRPSGVATGDVPVWNGTTFVVPTGTRNGKKFLRDDGAYFYPTARAHGGSTSAITVVNATGTAAGFANGTDLSSALAFTGDGATDFMLTVSAPTWLVTAATATLAVNLDGVNTATLITTTSTTASPVGTLRYVISAPAAGAHTVTARLFMTGNGNGTVNPFIVTAVEPI